MDEISMEIEKLLDAVHRSDEYQEYQKQAAQLEADPELKARVMRFRGDNFRLQNHSDKDALAFTIQERMSAYHGQIKAGTYLLSTAYTPTRIIAVLSGEESKEGSNSQ